MTLHKIQTHYDPDAYALIPEPGFSMAYKRIGKWVLIMQREGGIYVHFGHYCGVVEMLEVESK